MTSPHFPSREKQTTASLFFTLILGGCAMGPPSIPIHSQTLVGPWYGERMVGAELTMWLTDRQASGTFTTRFKRCSEGNTVFFQRKTGNWSLDGTSYTTVTTEISDGRQHWKPATPNRTFVQTYDIEQLTQNTLKYKSESQHYTAYKVDEDYKLTCKP